MERGPPYPQDLEGAGVGGGSDWLKGKIKWEQAAPLPQLHHRL